MVKLRDAQIEDIPYLKNLYAPYVESGVILFRSDEQIKKDISETYISVNSINELEKVNGSLTVKSFGDQLYEIRSLVIDPEFHKNHIGARLVEYSIRRTLEKLSGRKKYTFFALTLAPKFFTKIGFIEVDKEKYPDKIFFDCNHCIKKDHCDEVAVEKVVLYE